VPSLGHSLILLEVLTELVPSGRHFGVLNDPAISQPSGLQALAVTARARGVELSCPICYARPWRYRS
jgi:hypothetical protein